MNAPTHKTLGQLEAILRGSADRNLIRSISDEDWLQIICLANRDRHRVVPAIHHMLWDRQLQADLPDDVRSYLALLTKLNDERNAALRREIEQVISALNAASIAPLLLKGAATLLDQRYGLTARIIGDIDVLVPKAQSGDALAALLQDGFEPLPQIAAGHTVADLIRPGNVAAVDLHWELVDPPFQRLLPAVEVSGRACEPSDGNLRYRLPAVDDYALHSLIHAQVHHPGYYSRHLCLGVAREFAALQHAIDWNTVERWADLYQMQVVLEATLLASQQFFDMKWPLSRLPSETAIWHHKRACEVELTGRWDVGLRRWARLHEVFAPDRLSVRFGADRWHATRILYLCRSAMKRHSLQKLYGRLMAS